METKTKKAKNKEPAGAYKVLIGLNYPTASGEVRVEPGKVVTDIPERSIAWLTRSGAIVPVEKEES